MRIFFFQFAFLDSIIFISSHNGDFVNLKRFKINFLGDSITKGHGVSDISLRFISLLAQRHGIIEQNYDIGGTRIARKQNLSDSAKYDTDFCLRAELMQKDADIIFVFGGTNNFGYGDAHFGSSDDNTPDTFCGALNVLFTKLTITYLNSKIIVATPPTSTRRIQSFRC